MSMSSTKLYNPLKQKVGEGMPRFENLQWRDFYINLIPADNTRNLIRNILGRRDVIPYFYGKIRFDLGIAIPKKRQKSLQGEEIKYEWFFCSSKDDKVIKSDIGVMTLKSIKAFNYTKSKSGDVNHYGFEFTRVWFTHRMFRKVHAIDLGHVSKLDQYKVIMNFTDQLGNTSGNIIMLEFTLQDLDIHTMTIIYLAIGAGIGIIAGIIGYMFGIH
jgi:hypothetical protein